MNGKDLKKNINRIRLPKVSKERIIRNLEQIRSDAPEQTYSEEYVFDVKPYKTPALRYTMTAAACAVLAVTAAGVYVSNRVEFSPAMEITEQDEIKSITPEEFSSYLADYNQEHGTQLRFPTEDECIEAGITESECFDFFQTEFKDKESFLQYVEILAGKGETVISKFHRTNLYSDYGNGTDVIGYYYYPYNASGQTYGVAYVDNMRFRDSPDLVAVTTEEGVYGYITKEDFLGEEAHTLEEAAQLMEKRQQRIENGIYYYVVNAYASDGKTVVGTFHTECIDPEPAPDVFETFLADYNQKHGTQLRFPTEEEYREAGTTENKCLAFFAKFPDNDSFMQYIETLVEKGEIVISNFHRINLYSDAGAGTEVIGHYYYFYNTSGQTYGSNGVDGLKPEDEPDLISVMGDNDIEGYVYKKDLEEESPSSPEEAVRREEENGYPFRTLTVYESDGVTAIGKFTVGGIASSKKPN